jgi:hypothetical protein
MAKTGSRWKSHTLSACAALVLFFAGVLTVQIHAQAPSISIPGIRYSRGQDVSPVFEGWERNPDGTFSMWFGYYNRNDQEEVDVPLGPENTIDLGNGDDHGQPTHFYSGSRWWVFKVVVPKDWPVTKRLVWTLTNRGRTNLAKAWLEPEWEVDKALITSDAANDPFTGSLGRPSAESIAEGEMAPVISGQPAQTITLPAVAKLAVTVTDDGLPKMSAQDKDSHGDVQRGVQGVRVRWILYRGPGKVRFDPNLSPYVYGKPLTSQTQVSFSAPGNYKIRAIATDGALFSTYDVDVTVMPASKPARASDNSGG